MHEVVIIGAGPAGLGVAGCLVQRGWRPVVLERATTVASSWRAHYERLHLHTVKAQSALPGLPFPASAPRYVPRQGVVDYLDAYARAHAIEPRYGEEVVAIEPCSSTSPSSPDSSPSSPSSPSSTAADLSHPPRHARWCVRSASGQEFLARTVVLASGANREPRPVVLPGREAYTGQVLHSQAYRNAAPFTGQRVLVVGMGNTGAEISLDLCERGVQTALSVRSPVNMVYRDVLGRPTQLSSIMLSKLPTAWGDALATWLRNMTVGDLSRWGLRTAPISPLRQLREFGKTPVIDVGTLARIRQGEIAVHPGISRMTARGVRFVDAAEHAFDSVILATGYGAGLRRLFPGQTLPLDAQGLPLRVAGQGWLRGVYFVGFDIRQPGGLLRAISAQAVEVANAIQAEGGGAV